MDVAYVRGIQEVWGTAIVVWDDRAVETGGDVSLLVPDMDWPAAIPLARWIPKKGTVGMSSGWTFGMRQWTTFVYVEGLYYTDDERWMLVFRGDITRGGSGSPVVVNGETVGLATDRRENPAVLWAVPAGTLARIVRAYDRNGPMQP